MALTLPAGSFDQRIVFQRRGAGRNAINEPVDTWTDDFKAWARVRPIRQSDATGADQPQADATYLLTLRGCAGQPSSAHHRVLWSGGVYHISGEALKLDGGRYLQVRISSKANDV